uniref:Reverse transcriptase Ty1/copia-type domain-containing protein n=1 Tax=Cannabis sativa TaxID=3483 RepID=A0A803Q5A6_CANSA
MGKLCCSSEDDGIDLSGVLIVIVLALAIMAVCMPQQQRVVTVYRCRRWELCKSDCLWESLAKERWPFLGSLQLQPSSSSSAPYIPNFQGWRALYIQRHNEMAGRAMEVLKFVEQRSLSGSLGVGDYLKAIEDLHVMQFGFKDVELLLFKPKLNPLFNLVGLHYCINWLRVPAEYVLESLECCKISDREVCVKWWKLGRWFYGFRMRDESRFRIFCMADFAMAKEEEVLAVLHRGAIHEVIRVQISIVDSSDIPWITKSRTIYILLYVDGILIPGSSMAVVSSLISNLNASVSLKDIGEIDYFLGIQVTHLDNGLHLCQKKYVMDLLCRTKDFANSLPTPMTGGEKLSAQDGDPVANPHQ